MRPLSQKVTDTDTEVLMRVSKAMVLKAMRNKFLSSNDKTWVMYFTVIQSDVIKKRHELYLSLIHI